LELREPYRIRGVQSFGDKWAFRRILGAPCREGVRSSNEKSLLIRGSIADIFAQRTGGSSEAGGESVRRDRASQQFQLSQKPLFERPLEKSIASLRIMEHRLIAARLMGVTMGVLRWETRQKS
jgi:hypothetical protein